MEKKNNKKSFGKGFFLGILVSVLIIAMVGCQGNFSLFDRDNDTESESESRSSRKKDKDEDSSDELIDDLTAAKIKDIQDLLDEYYLYDYDEELLREGLYDGMVDILGDPYTVYYNEEETASFYESSSGNYSGVGIVLQQDPETSVITVVRTFSNSPAAETDIQKGDILKKVDGEDITGGDLSEIVTNIRGEVGTEVDVTFERDGKETDYTLERADIDQDTVYAYELDDHIGYIAVTEFDDVTYDQFETAFTDLRDNDIEGLIIDLRDNPGGNVSTTVDMLDLLLPDGLLVYTVDKNDDREEYHSSGDDKIDIPVVILVNESSASASEIFSGACQDHEIAKVVGTQSFGKGVVQTIIPLGDDTSMKITISRYYTPNGRSIDGEGITPDVVEELDEGVILSIGDKPDPETDNQVEKAIEVLKEDIK